MLKISENIGTEEIGLVTPIPGIHDGYRLNYLLIIRIEAQQKGVMFAYFCHM